MSSAKIVLVTGTSRGIGREIAGQLAARGCRVFAAQRSGTGPAGTETLRLEVRDAASVASALAEVKAAASHLDVLVNNAAILLDEGVGILDLEPGLLQETLATNTVAPLRLAQAFWPLLGRGSRIINLSSSGGQLSTMGGWAPGYCISKTALNAVTVQLSKIGKPAGIAVNSVCPGWVRTDMGGPSAPDSVAEGADTAVWLALEAPQSLSGCFLQDRREIPW